MNLYRTSLLLLCVGLAAGCGPSTPPNVIIVITDDQGYGDIGAHGNTMIETPVLDQLHSESVRLVDFHVDPTCSPTRSSLLTGRYSSRTGVWHTIMGRSLMRPEEVTIAEVFRDAGYRTGMVGKWHLGDNYPVRPQDQGFEEVFYHPAGGVTQGTDWFGNDYFDDTFLRNGEYEATTGYVTDVWFDDALRFIEDHQEEPFFLFLSTNAPHGPLRAPEEYIEPYRQKGVPYLMDVFYAMITNIDDNMGRLTAKLDDLGLSDNTILVFMTDNGTASGFLASAPADAEWTGFNAGMRDGKGSYYDGGHRVPFFVRYPNGRLSHGEDVAGLTAHIDVLPTIASLAGVSVPGDPELDGIDLKRQLRGRGVPERTLFVHSQRISYPEKWRQSAVMDGPWRLINGTELYNLESDFAQETDVAEEFPEEVARLREAYEGWWASLEPSFEGYVRIVLGSDEENPSHLNAHDWHVDGRRFSVWNHRQVSGGLNANGYWAVDVMQPGTYSFELRRWPTHGTYVDSTLGATEAVFIVGEDSVSQPVDLAATHATFTVDLEAGPTTIQSVLTTEDGEERGAYNVYATRLGVIAAAEE